MEIREYTQYKENEIQRLYRAAGWTYDEAALRRGGGSPCNVFAAYENGMLLGVLRTVGTGPSVSVIRDITVFSEERRYEVYAALINAMLGRYPDVRRVEFSSVADPKLASYLDSTGAAAFPQIFFFGLLKF